jgi:hypothetical protein
MSKTYSPGLEADVIVEQQLAKGNYASADEVVRAGSARDVRRLSFHEDPAPPISPAAASSAWPARGRVQ